MLPVIPNSPLMNLKSKMKLGRFNLRKNKDNKFVENYLFKQRLVNYNEYYENNQSLSKKFQDHMYEMYNNLKKKFPKGSKLVEVGCGQGDFLKIVENDKYFNFVGFDKAYKGKNKKIFKRYINLKDKQKVDVVILRHVLEHIKKPHLFLSHLKRIFAKTKIYLEVPCFDWIIKNNAFFDLTYEHVNYFNKKSLISLFDNKFVNFGKCFGGQYQYIITDLNNLSEKFTKSYNSKKWHKLNLDKLFPKFKKKILEIEKISKKKNRIFVWGAATKGCMFIIHCMKNKKLINKISYAIDINKEKCNKFLPVSYKKIISKEKYFKNAKSNDLVIVSNENYLDEIKKDFNKMKLKKIKIISL